MIDVIVGAQFGSEAKGAVACALAQQHEYDLLVRVAGPNAGHTGYDAKDRKWAMRQIPVACIWNLDATIYLGPGSEIDIDVLREEVALLDVAGFEVSSRLFISPQATILLPEHRFREQTMQMHETMGSTGKGVGAARAERIMRKGPIAGNMADDGVLPGMVGYLNTNQGRVMIEGTQGFGLGLHAGYYPHCTSSDCRAIDFLAMADVNLNNEICAYVVARTFPIRVAGPSGELPFEVTWEQLHAESGGYIQPERTTVTQKIRRVARFDPILVNRALAANHTRDHRARLCLQFWDYVNTSTFGVTDTSHGSDTRREIVAQAAKWLDHNGVDPALLYSVGTGPSTWVTA